MLQTVDGVGQGYALKGCAMHELERQLCFCDADHCACQRHLLSLYCDANH